MNLINQLPIITLLIVFMLLISYGAWLVLRGLRHYCDFHVIKGSGSLLGGSLLCALGLVLMSAFINITTYDRLTHEQQVARLFFVEVAPQQYLASISFTRADLQQEFEIFGDEWQLDAKVLKWHSYANLLGLDAQYKLHRLSGRYQTLSQAQQTPSSVYELHAEPGIDLWEFAYRYPQFLPLVDAYYGSAVFLPMSDQAHFDVFMTQSGLIARPVKKPADTLQRW